LTNSTARATKSIAKNATPVLPALHNIEGQRSAVGFVIHSLCGVASSNHSNIKGAVVVILLWWSTATSYLSASSCLFNLASRHNRRSAGKATWMIRSVWLNWWSMCVGGWCV